MITIMIYIKHGQHYRVAYFQIRAGSSLRAVSQYIMLFLFFWRSTKTMQNLTLKANAFRTRMTVIQNHDLPVDLDASSLYQLKQAPLLLAKSC
jgi:hypothetical protein